MASPVVVVVIVATVEDCVPTAVLPFTLLTPVAAGIGQVVEVPVVPALPAPTLLDLRMLEAVSEGPGVTWAWALSLATDCAVGAEGPAAVVAVLCDAVPAAGPGTEEGPGVGVGAAVDDDGADDDGSEGGTIDGITAGALSL